MTPVKRLAGFAGVLLLLMTRPVAGIEMTLDSGAGSMMLTDSDLDGIIDFNLTIGGIFQARGRAFEQIFANTTIVSLTTDLPPTEALFRNIGAADATFTVTINSSAFTAVGPPLGWAVFYNGRVADSMSGTVNVSSHSLQASVNAGALVLAALPGTPLAAPAEFAFSTSGVNPSDNATDLRVVFTFTLGPDDEIRLPDNNDVDGNAIQVSVFNQEFKCLDKMNNFARKVLNSAQKSDATCVTEGVKADGADETTCVDDPADEKTEKAETKLLDKFDEFCAPNLPSWGVNGEKCCEGGANDGDPCLVDLGCPGGACVRGACISGAAERAANETTHDLFGATVNVTDGSDTGKCQKKVTNAAGKLLVEHWKTFRNCKKDNFDSISSDSDLVATCLGPPQPDPKGSIGKRLTKLTDFIAEKCVAKDVTPVGPAFPGECTAAADGDMATCISGRVSCRFCQGINVADDIAPPLDCDVFDDSMGNASCP